MCVCYIMFCVQLLGHMLVVAERIVTELGAKQIDGYRVVMNNDLHHEQTNYHPQIHVMAGTQLGLSPR